MTLTLQESKYQANSHDVFKLNILGATVCRRGAQLKKPRRGNGITLPQLQISTRKP